MPFAYKELHSSFVSLAWFQPGRSLPQGTSGGGHLGEGQGVSEWLNLCTSSDCFEWGLIDDIDQQRVHSLHWQF